MIMAYSGGKSEIQNLRLLQYFIFSLSKWPFKQCKYESIGVVQYMQSQSDCWLNSLPDDDSQL